MRARPARGSKLEFRAWSGTGPVAQLVFKTGEVWQPHAGSVRLRGRSVTQNYSLARRLLEGQESSLYRNFVPNRSFQASTASIEAASSSAAQAAITRGRPPATRLSN